MYTLSDFGAYVAGGRAVEVRGRPVRDIAFTRATSYRFDPNGTFPVEHAYVQYFRPEPRNGAPPVVLLHGGGMSGAMWETTPDGRPGWLHGLLRRGYEVHVVDNVERGRAGWCPIAGIWPGEPILRSMEEAWTLFRFGAAADFAARRAFAGQRFPVAMLETLARGFVPRWTTTTQAAVAALAAVLDRTGPAILLCHSQGAEVAFEAAAARPGKVRAVVAAEPSGFAEGLTAIAGVPVLTLFGDFLDCDDTWRGLTARCRRFEDDLRAHGGQVEHLELAQAGVRGNSHMLMMDDNNLEVLDRILAWLERR